MSNVLGLVVGFAIRTSLWLRRSRDAIGKEEKWKNLDKILCIFYFIFFMRNLGMCIVPRFIIRLPSLLKKV
jgi:hypothetical protein